MIGRFVVGAFLRLNFTALLRCFHRQHGGFLLSEFFMFGLEILWYHTALEQTIQAQRAEIQLLKRRVAEFETSLAAVVPSFFYISETQTIHAYVPAATYQAAIKERDLARKTLDDLRAVMNGAKLSS